MQAQYERDKALFQKKLSKDYSRKIAEKNKRNFEKQFEQLEELAALLITKGHVNVLDYGYSFFKLCARVTEKEFKMMIAGMAFAIGLGLFGKKEQYDELLKENNNGIGNN